MVYTKHLMAVLFLALCFLNLSFVFFPNYALFEIYRGLPIILNLIVSLIFLGFSFFVVFFPMYKYSKNPNDKFWGILTILNLLMVLIIGLYQIYLEFI